MNKRQLSEQAQVAKRIREFCKSLGVKCIARSDSFSMGDSVHWSITDQHPDIVKQIKDFAEQHQYGSFNGMEDIYEDTNSRSDIPQTKYCHGGCEYSAEIRQKALDWLRSEHLANYENIPQAYNDAKKWNWINGNQAWDGPDWTVETHVSQVLTGEDFRVKNWRNFWDSLNKPKSAPVSVISGSAHIEEHTHTKKNFQMFIVVMAEHVDRDEFNRLRDEAQALGGWYSRKWGSTPCGFAFRDLATAEQFLSEQFGGDTPPTGTDDPKPAKPDTHKANKLRSIADKMQPVIDSKFADRLTNTAKRQAQAAHARLEGERLQRTQSVLYALADLHESCKVPQILIGLSTKKAVYDLMVEKLVPVNNGFHCYHYGTGEPSNDDDLTIAAWSLLTAKSEEQKIKEDIERKIQGLQFSSIPGYFPTPKVVTDLMLSYVDIKEHDNILEPSIGSGNIADQICEKFTFDNGINVKNYITACEYNATLAEISSAKGYRVNNCDFLTVDLGESYDCVLMNPPFEKLQDIDHVKHAFKFLKDGGRLVSVMSPGPFFRSDRKCKDFRDWVHSLGGEVIDLPDGSFKESGTVVASKLLILDK